MFDTGGTVVTYLSRQGVIPGAQAYALAREQRRPILHALVLALIAFALFSSVFVSKTFPFQLRDSAPIAGLSLPGIGASPREEPVLTSAVLPETMRREELVQALAITISQPAGEAVASAEVLEAPPPEPVRSYDIYSVRAGDTASAVAERFGITLEYLLWNNAELRDEDFLTIGQQLFIPADNGILHYVSLGETLGGVANYYGVALDNILSWPGNGITSPDQIVEGELIFVLGGVPPAPAISEPVLVEAPPPAPAPPPAVGGPISNAGLIWPFVNPISSTFGDGRGHTGIDIDGVGRHGAAIGAATSGTVTLTTNCCGRGNYVMIVNDAGTVRTLYAHLSRINVQLGQHVSQGQDIGIIGCTGVCTGTHLHFEIHVMRNGVWVTVNPLNYLP